MNNKKPLLNISRRLLLDNSLTEKRIAKILYISETSLRNIYNENFGLPPKKYIHIIKIKKAKTLLRTSNKKISEIAYITGYINVSKFSNAFKKIYGITPSKYRENCGFGVDKTLNKMI